MLFHPGDEIGAILDKLRYFVKRAVPHLFLFLLFVLQFLPFESLTGSVGIRFLLMGIFFWSLFRPTLLPLYVVFMYGLATDVLYGYAIGLYAVIYTLICFFIRYYRQRLSSQSFWLLWAMFGLILTFLMGVDLLYSQVFMGGHFPLFQALGKVVLSALVFPFVNMLLFYQNLWLSKK